MTQEITTQFLSALSERNIDAIVNLFADEVDWYIPGNETLAPWLGKRSTRQEVKEFYQLLWQSTLPVAATIDHIFVDGNKAVIAGSFTSKMLQTGAMCTSLFFIHFTVINNQIVRYRLLEDTYEVVKALTL
jgi:ketosteroid isomerase-like protein